MISKFKAYLFTRTNAKRLERFEQGLIPQPFSRLTAEATINGNRMFGAFPIHFKAGEFKKLFDSHGNLLSGAEASEELCCAVALAFLAVRVVGGYDNPPTTTADFKRAVNAEYVNLGGVPTIQQ